MTLNRDLNSGELKVAGALDIESANALREALLDCLVQLPSLSLDLSEVEACDTAALQVLLAGRNSAVELGKPFHVSACSGHVAELSAALGLGAQPWGVELSA